MRASAVRLLTAALSLCAALLTGCAIAPARAPAALPPDVLMDAAFAAPAQPVDAGAVLALSPAMQHYLDVEIAPMLRAQGRHRGLVEALYSKAHLRLEYDTDTTRTAAEAFDARAGNCLSLVLMTAALAKHLDLAIEYRALVGHETWSRSGNLSFINGHVNVTVGKRLIDRIAGLETDSSWRLDFGSLAVGRGASMRAVNEATILAMFMNNRAAESLLRGDAVQAYAYAREAVRQDPGFAAGYNTLGVIYRLQGLADAAERAYRHTLALDSEHRAALDNLARLYESQHREGDAAPLRQVLRRLDREPPFLHFDLAREAIGRGDYAAARDHLQRELKRDPDYHEFHYWMAITLAALGDTRGASKHLASAMHNSTTRNDHALYAGKLERLKSLQRVN